MCNPNDGITGNECKHLLRYIQERPDRDADLEWQQSGEFGETITRNCFKKIAIKNGFSRGKAERLFKTEYYDSSAGHDGGTDLPRFEQNGKIIGVDVKTNFRKDSVWILKQGTIDWQINDCEQDDTMIVFVSLDSLTRQSMPIEKPEYITGGIVSYAMLSDILANHEKIEAGEPIPEIHTEMNEDGYVIKRDDCNQISESELYSRIIEPEIEKYRQDKLENQFNLC